MAGKTLFSIGEMSKIHQVSIKTLRYYDKIELFKPEQVDRSSGYRYYSYRQFETLNTIRFLKYLGISLDNIRLYLGVRGKKEYLELLEREKKIVLEEIMTLKQMMDGIEDQIKEVSDTLKNISINKIEIKEIEKRHVIARNIKIHNMSDLEIAIHDLKNEVMGGKPVIIGLVGVSVRKDNLNAGVFESYDAILIRSNDKNVVNVEESAIRVLEAGRYVCLNYVGNDHSKSPMYYKKLMTYINEHQLTVIGDSIERVIINEYKTNDASEYLTEIQIPIQ